MFNLYCGLLVDFNEKYSYYSSFVTYIITLMLSINRHKIILNSIKFFFNFIDSNLTISKINSNSSKLSQS